MDSHMIRSIVDKVVEQYQQGDANQGEPVRDHTINPPIPIGVSARHVHLSKDHLDLLFGEGYELTKKFELSQPGQFAANETVTVVGPKGSIETVRILGPVRGATQVEVSKTDSFKLGVQPPLRESGDIKGSAPATLVGPQGSVYIREGVIIAQNHIHMTPEDAMFYGVQNGQFVQVYLQGQRPVVFDRVLIRESPRYKLEMHIDTDEANAALCVTGNQGIIRIPSIPV